MRVRVWALAALGVFLGAFVAAWVVDASLPQAYNLSDPQIWALAAAIAALALGGLARARQDRLRDVFAGVVIGLALCLVLVGGFYVMGGAGSVTVEVHRSDQQPVAALNPNETHERVPELARALDRLVESNRSEVIVAHDTETFDRIQAYLNDEIGDYTDPFSWRGTSVEVRASRG